MHKIISITLLISLMFLSLATTVVAAPPAQEGEETEQMQADQPAGQEYVVQQGDWLSRLAEKYLGDLSAYGIIIEATNERAAQDNTFTVIVDPNLIEAGQKLWIPLTQEMTGQMAQSQPELAGTYSMLVMPEGNEGQFFNLTLNPDNTASLRTDFGLGSDANPLHETGTWQMNQDGTLTVTLDPPGSTIEMPQNRMVFELQDGKLVARDLDLRNAVFGGLQGITLTKQEQMAQQPADQAGQMPTDQPAFIGTHQMELAMASGPGRDILLDLNSDHSVIRITRFIGPESNPVVETGVWRANPDGTVTVLISAEVGEAFYAEPDVIKFAVQNGQLTPVEYDLNWEATQDEITPEQPEVAQQPDQTETAQQPDQTETAQQSTDVPQPKTDSEFIGVYERSVDTTIGPDRQITLDLNNDFSALKITHFSNSDIPVVEFGTWELNEDGTATVTLVGYINDELHETPDVLTFQLQDGQLTATDYNQDLYGPEGVQFSEAVS